VTKSSILLLLLASCGLAETAQQGVGVLVRSCRTEFRTHNRANAPGFVCTLELVPPPGFYMCESAELAGQIRVKEATGSVRLADLGGVTISAANRAYTTFSLPRRPSGNKLEISGDLQVTVAAERIAYEPLPVSALEASAYQLSDSILYINPARSNSSAGNREGTKLRCAEFILRGEPIINIRRIERVWQSMTGRELTQPVELENVGDISDGVFRIQLWDANPTEQLRIVTVKSPRREKVSFRFGVQLGKVTTNP